MHTLKRYLEELTDLRRINIISFRADNGGLVTIKDRIAEVYDRDGLALLRTAEGLEIRLTAIVEVNGRGFSYSA